MEEKKAEAQTASRKDAPLDAAKKYPFIELLTTVAGVTVLLAALLYAAGWSYLYQYYKDFGVNIAELDLPLYQNLIYALPVIYSSNWSIFWLLSAVIGIGSALNFKVISDRLLTPLGVCLFLAAILSLGAWLSRRGTHLGDAQASTDMVLENTTLPSISLSVQADPAFKGTADEDFSQPDYRLLIHANGRYYFFKPLAAEGLAQYPTVTINLFSIPDSRVQSVRIDRGVDSSKLRR